MVGKGATVCEYAAALLTLRTKVVVMTNLSILLSGIDQDVQKEKEKIFIAKGIETLVYPSFSEILLD